MAKQKCYECNKGINLIDSITCKCRCGNIYCKYHKFEHQCQFDYKEYYKETNNLVKLIDIKVEKI